MNTDKDYGGAHHRDSEGDNECVSDISTLGEKGTVVDDEVDTGELLKHDASPRAESVSAAIVAEVVDVDASTQSTFSFKCLINQVSSHHSNGDLAKRLHENDDKRGEAVQFTRHEGWLRRAWVALRTMEDRREPMEMANWYMPTIIPRRCFGDTSDW